MEGGVVIQEVMLPADQAEMSQVAKSLQAIGHPTRLKILCYLSEQEKMVNEVLGHVGTTQSNISQHIDILRQAGILGSRRSHNRVYCYLEKREMLPLIRQIRDIFCSQEQQGRPLFF